MPSSVAHSRTPDFSWGKKVGLALPVAVHNTPRVIFLNLISKPRCACTPAEDSLYRTCAPHHLISTAAHSHTPLTIFIDLHAYMYAECTTHACRLRLHILLGAYFLSNSFLKRQKNVLISTRGCRNAVSCFTS